MNREEEHKAIEKTGRLIQHLKRRYRRVKKKRLAARFLISISVFLAGFSLLVWFEQQVYFSSTGKILWSSGLVIFGILSFYWWNRAVSVSSGTFPGFYSAISQATQLPSLKHAFDLKLYSRDSHLRLYSAALKRNIEDISWEKARPGIHAHIKNLPESKLFRQSLGAIVLSGAMLAFSGLTHTDALIRSARLWQDFQKPNPYSFTILPGNTTIEQGSAFQPEISFKGPVPELLLMGIKTDVEEKFRFRPLRRKTGGIFTPDPVNLSSNATYFVRMDEFNSGRYEVRVQLRPRFESLTVTVSPPDYTKLDSTIYTYPFSRIKAYEGSNIRITGRTNKPVDTLTLVSTVSGDSVASGDRNFTFQQKIISPDTLRFEMSDTSGLKNNNHFEFTIEAVGDEYPFVQIIKPEDHIEQGTPSPVDIAFEAGDDFGITSASLEYELQRAFVEKPETGSIDVAYPESNSTRTFTWDLTRLNPRPRDVITFWLKVTDNDGYNGYKSSISKKLAITLPSLVDNLDEIGEEESDIRESLENISESYEEMRKEYDRFKENLKENPEINWEQKQMLEDVREKQQEMDQQVEELNKKFEEIREKINQNNLISEETRKAYEELQQLIEEINDPELQKALEELQKALGNLSQQQLRKALEEFEFNEDVYRERLNRTLELFKALKLNSDLEKLATALEDLAKKEDELSKSDAPPSDKAEHQKAIQNDTEQVSDQLEKLDEDPPRDAEEEIQKLQKENRQELESIKKELQQNIEQLNQPNPGEGQPSPRQQQQQIQRQFQQMAQRMRAAKQQFTMQRTQINMTALQNILYNLINLSEEQEELTQGTEHLANRSQAFVEKARIEKNISRQFTHISDSLFAVSSEIPGFSNKINKKKKEVERDLNLAVEQLAERNKSQSTYAERQSLGGINHLASMVASLIDQLHNQAQGGMGGGMSMQQFMEQLKNMTGDQQKLNQQIQDLINDIQGNRLTSDQIDRLNQMARQQNQIRKQIKQLQENGELEAGDRLLSELERLAEEMEQTINDLRGGQTDRLLIKRQQNILSRMLNAEKALQERDKSEEREGTAAKEAPKSVPPEITLEELQKKIRNLLNDPNQTKFSEDYQKLIEQYFELLKKLREKGISS